MIKINGVSSNRQYYGTHLVFDYKKGVITGGPLTFVNTHLTDTATFRVYEYFNNTGLKYSYDGVVWNDPEWTSDGDKYYDVITLTPGQSVQFRASVDKTSNWNKPTQFRDGNLQGSIKVSGNPLSLHYVDFENVDTYHEYEFMDFMNGFKRLVHAGDLTFDVATIPTQCLYRAFKNSGLVVPPVLPATTINNYGYNEMFCGCTSLLTIPTLPVFTAYGDSLRSMFSDCSSLTSIPAIQAAYIGNHAAVGMFSRCTGLTAAPDITITTADSFACEDMFMGCTSILSAGAINVTNRGEGDLIKLFEYCTALVTPPTLPSTPGQQHGMFRGCISLVTGPVIPYATLPSWSCYQMFQGCSSLVSVTCLATNISQDSCVLEWMDGVAANGTFTKNAAMNDWPTGTSGIPSGWTVVDAA